MKKILTIALCLYLYPAIAQKNLKFSPGYMVRLGDTLRGFIKSDIQKRLQNTCVFRSTVSGDSKEYSPDQIDGFLIQGLGFFRSKKEIAIEGEADQNYFLQELESGKATLLFLIDGRNRNHYFIDKNDTIQELVKKETFDRTESGLRIKRTDYLFRGILGKVFRDCPQKLNKLELFRSSLVKIVNDYNRCKDSSHTIFIKPKNDKRIYIGYSFGLAQNTLITQGLKSPFFAGFNTYGVFDLKDYSQQYLFSSNNQGVTFESKLGNNTHVSLLGGVFINKLSLDNSKLNLNFTNLDIPLQVKYSSLLRYRVRPFASLGILFPITLENQSFSKGVPAVDYLRNPIFKTNGSRVLVEPLERENFLLSQLRFIASLGMDFNISDRAKISIQYRIEETDLSKSDQIDLTLRSNNIISGFSYRFIK